MLDERGMAMRLLRMSVWLVIVCFCVGTVSGQDDSGPRMYVGTAGGNLFVADQNDTIVLWGHAFNFGPDVRVDVYVVLIDPNGVIYSLPDFNTEMMPFFSDVLLPEGWMSSPGDDWYSVIAQHTLGEPGFPANAIRPPRMYG